MYTKCTSGFISVPFFFGTFCTQKKEEKKTKIQTEDREGEANLFEQILCCLITTGTTYWIACNVERSNKLCVVFYIFQTVCARVCQQSSHKWKQPLMEDMKWLVLLDWRPSGRECLLIPNQGGKAPWEADKAQQTWARTAFTLTTLSICQSWQVTEKDMNSRIDIRNQFGKYPSCQRSKQSAGVDLKNVSFVCTLEMLGDIKTCCPWNSSRLHKSWRWQ